MEQRNPRRQPLRLLSPSPLTGPAARVHRKVVLLKAASAKGVNSHRGRSTAGSGSPQFTGKLRSDSRQKSVRKCMQRELELQSIRTNRAYEVESAEVLPVTARSRVPYQNTESRRERARCWRCCLACQPAALWREETLDQKC